jgi:hypothetical protein
MKYRVIKKKGEDYRVLAWWISASRALRDPRRDKGLPPWNMTPPEDKSNLLFRFLHPLFQALKPIKHTQTWARRRGARPQEATSKQKQEGGRQQEKKWKTQAVLVWVCGKVALGREAVKGPFVRPAPAHGPLGFI